LQGLQELGLDFGKCLLIPNGVATPSIEAVCIESSPAFEKPYLLYVGRLALAKGLDLLLRSFKLSDVDCNLVIAGDDKNQYGSYLKKLSVELMIDHKVIFLGQIDTIKWPLYKNALALLLTSHSENFGNVVLEAMAMACPVVVTNGVGASEVVSANNAGYIVTSTTEAIAQAIIKIVNDKSRASLLGLNGASAVAKRYTWTGIVEMQMNMYRRSLSKENNFKGTS